MALMNLDSMKQWRCRCGERTVDTVGERGWDELGE